MRKLPLNKDLIVSRLEEIRKDIEELKVFTEMNIEEFKKGKNFAIAEHYLRRGLEAIFDIGSHILSRIPGAKATTYKEIAINLGKYKILPESFAKETLTKMAGYRNRLTHFYFEIGEQELLEIIKNHLSDLEEFCKYIVNFISQAKN